MPADVLPNHLFQEGINLMFFGMGFVFVFLTVLVFSTAFMSRMVTAYEAKFPQADPATNSTARPVTTINNDKQLLAVLSAAVHKFRSRQK